MVSYRLFTILLSCLLMLCSLSACVHFTTAYETVISEPVVDIDPNQLSEEFLPASLEARITSVVSGDVIEVAIADTIYKVRYIGVNIPQTFQSIEYFQDEAYKKNCELVEGKTVRLEKDSQDTDKDGCLLRYVWLDTTMVNAELVRLGCMQTICSIPNVKYQNILFASEQEAMYQYRGLWAVDTHNNAPIINTLIGSKKSKMYHYSSCKLVANISDTNKVYFFLPINATAGGYTPCNVCKPPSRSCSAGAFNPN